MLRFPCLTHIAWHVPYMMFTPAPCASTDGCPIGQLHGTPDHIQSYSHVGIKCTYHTQLLMLHARRNARARA